MQGQQILVSIDIEEFWRQMRVLIEDVLIEKNIISHSSENNSSAPKLLKAKEVCELFQVSKPTIYDWMQKGKLRSIKIESRRFFLHSDIEELIRKNKCNQ
jgi:excisionase family DNA binding protein